MLKIVTDLFMGNDNPLGKGVNSGQKTSTQLRMNTIKEIEELCNQRRESLMYFNAINKNLSPEQKQEKVKEIELSISNLRKDLLDATNIEDGEQATDLFMGNDNPFGKKSQRLGKGINTGFLEGFKDGKNKKTQVGTMTRDQIEKLGEDMKNILTNNMPKNLSPEKQQEEIKYIELRVSTLKNELLNTNNLITPEVYKQNKELLEKESLKQKKQITDSLKQAYDKNAKAFISQLNNSEPKQNQETQTPVQVSQGVKKAVSEVLENPKASNSKNTINFDILDLSRVIDINAESRAVEAYDEMIRNSKEGNPFKKAGGFLKRSFYRMTRDAWIESKKRLFIKEIREGLKTGNYTEDVLRAHSIEANRGIEERAYLSHEEIKKDSENIPAPIKLVIDEWLNAPSKSPIRTKKIKELKTLLETHYPITADLNQLESALTRVEKNKIPGDLGTIEAKLNLFDIGRTRDGYGDKINGNNRKSFVVNMFGNIENSSLPKKLKGFLQNPNLSAVLSALGTRSLVSAAAGGAALGFGGGLLAPVFAGASVGGLLAFYRSKSEIKDRNAQIDRRGANGNNTGIKDTDGESVDNLSKPLYYQHSTKYLYDRVSRVSENREDALIAGIYYLVKHRVGSETDLNMLQYEQEKSVAKQHVDMIILLNKVFPGLVSRFNSKDLFDETKTDNEAQLTRRLYAEILNLANNTLYNRNKLEESYAKKQGVIFGGVAAGVGLGVGIALHEFGYGSIPDTKAPDTFKQVPGEALATTSYPDNLIAYTNVKRPEWFDLKTPAPKFEGTELKIHTDKSGGWNVTGMLGKSPFNKHINFGKITPLDFTSGKIQAVVTPENGGPSFTLPIDSKGNIQIPDSLKDIFAQRSFKYLEVGKVITNGSEINLTPIATVPGSGKALFDIITTFTPGETITETIPGETIPGTTPWYGVPFGGNKYRHLGVVSPKDKNNEEPIPPQVPPTTTGITEEPTPPQVPPTTTGITGEPTPPQGPPTTTGITGEPTPPQGPISKTPVDDIPNNTQTPFLTEIDRDGNNEKSDNFTKKIINLETEDIDINKVNESLNSIGDKDFVIVGTKVEGEFVKVTRNGDKLDLEFFENGNFTKKETIDNINIGYPDKNSGYKFAEFFYNGNHYGNVKELIFYYYNTNSKQDLEKTTTDEQTKEKLKSREDFKALLEKSKRGDSLEIGEYVYRRVNNGWQKFDKSTSLATKDYLEGIFMSDEQVINDFEIFNNLEKSQKETINPEDAKLDALKLYEKAFEYSTNSIIGNLSNNLFESNSDGKIEIPETLRINAERIVQKAKNDAIKLYSESFINAANSITKQFLIESKSNSVKEIIDLESPKISSTKSVALNSSQKEPINPQGAKTDALSLYEQTFEHATNSIVGNPDNNLYKSTPDSEIEMPENLRINAEKITEKAKNDALNLYIQSFKKAVDVISAEFLGENNNYSKKVIDLEIQDVYIEKLNESLNLINEDQIVILGTKVEGNHIKITRNGDKFELQQFVDGKSIGQTQLVEYLNILYPFYSSGFKFAETNYNGNHYGNIKEIIIYTKVKKSVDKDDKSTVSLENFKKSLENSKIGDKVEIGDYIYKKVNNGWKQFNKDDNLITADYIKLVKENDLINIFSSVK